MMSEFQKLYNEIMREFLDKFEGDLILYPDKAGETLQNMINKQKGDIASRAIQFTIKKMMEKKK